MIPAAPKETVGEAGIEPGTAAFQPGISLWTLPLSYSCGGCDSSVVGDVVAQTLKRKPCDWQHFLG
jgi:hypothetical protein